MTLSEDFEKNLPVPDEGRYRKEKGSKNELVKDDSKKQIAIVPEPMTLAECTDYLKPIADLMISYINGKYNHLGGESCDGCEEDHALIQMKTNKHHPEGVLSIKYDNPALDQVVKLKLSHVGDDGSFHVYSKLHYRKGEVDDNQHASGYNFLHMKFVPGDSNHLGMDMEKCILYAGETRDLVKILHDEVNLSRIGSQDEKPKLPLIPPRP